MKNYICVTCGTQYKAGDQPPSQCKICEDNRQYVGWSGQEWTTLEDMWKDGYKNVIRQLEPDLFGIGTEPGFGIGQRSLLVKTERGNVLWDPVSFLDSRTIEEVHALGGIQAISVSHPHFYASMIEWSHAFDRAPVFLTEADREWIMRRDGVVSFFEGKIDIMPGITVYQCGGHFPGSSIMHFKDGADGRGALLAGDTIMVAMDRKTVSFMYSYPNLIPLSAVAVRNIADRVAPIAFDRIYSAWWDRDIMKNAGEIVSSSAQRYIEAISDRHVAR
ncbi:MAG: hypothetical protein WAL90_02550 [Desulfobacterales bacterium]